MSSEPLSPRGQGLQETESDVAVRAVDLGKCYRIFDRPQDRLKQTLFQSRRQYYRSYWALRHVSFELRRGETLGIIGRNGSGKSTLLQLLCGTLTASEGTCACNGRLAALLELGSGFNPDFTGLENVYLYASLLGLNKQQTDERLDAILGFADIGDFVRQPVKSYSSGMAVRLAFAVVAHVDADILVVDEALSVGDVFFVQKCMRFIKRFKESNTLILVTHDSQSLLTVCSHGIVLANGRMITEKVGARKAIQAYVDHAYLRRDQQADHPRSSDPALQPSQEAPSEQDLQTIKAQVNVGMPQLQVGSSPEEQKRTSETLQQTIAASLQQGHSVVGTLSDCEETGEFWNGECSLNAIKVVNTDASRSAFLAEGEKIEITITATCNKAIDNPIIGFAIRNKDGLPVIGENTLTLGAGSRGPLQPGEVICARFRFTMPRISPGQYTLYAAIARGTPGDITQMHYFHDICAFEVVSLKPCYALTCPSDMMVELT